MVTRRDGDIGKITGDRGLVKILVKHIDLSVCEVSSKEKITGSVVADGQPGVLVARYYFHNHATEPKIGCQALMPPLSVAKINCAGAAGLVGVSDTTKSLVVLATTPVGAGRNV